MCQVRGARRTARRKKNRRRAFPPNVACCMQYGAKSLRKSFRSMHFMAHGPFPAREWRQAAIPRFDDRDDFTESGGGVGAGGESGSKSHHLAHDGVRWAAGARRSPDGTVFVPSAPRSQCRAEVRRLLGACHRRGRAKSHPGGREATIVFNGWKVALIVGLEFSSRNRDFPPCAAWHVKRGEERRAYGNGAHSGSAPELGLRKTKTPFVIRSATSALFMERRCLRADDGRTRPGIDNQAFAHRRQVR